MKDATENIVVLSWHPGDSVILTAGGFKRLYEILKYVAVDTVVIDKYPSLYSSIDNKNIKIIEYGTCLNHLKFLSRIHVMAYKLIERILTPFLILWVYVFKVIHSKSSVIYVPYSELPQLSFAGVLIKVLYGLQLVLCNLNVNTISIDRKLNVKFHALADRIITISTSLKTDLEKIGINPKFLNGVGFDLPEKYKNIHTQKIIDAIFVGRHVREKGIFDLAEIWNLVINKYKKTYKLVTIGDQIEIDELNNLVKKYNLKDHISFKGNLNDDQKYITYKQAKICVFPSLQEGWGIVPLEALSCGLPVVLYDLPVYNESLGFGPAIHRVSTGDHESFAKKVIELMESNENLENIAERSLQTFSWDTIADKEVKIILNGL